MNEAEQGEKCRSQLGLSTANKVKPLQLQCSCMPVCLISFLLFSFCGGGAKNAMDAALRALFDFPVSISAL